MSIFGTVVRLVQIQLHIHHFFSHIPHNAIMSSNRTCLIPERERERGDELLSTRSQIV